MLEAFYNTLYLGGHYN